jgi:hypothetical protein
LFASLSSEGPPDDQSLVIPHDASKATENWEQTQTKRIHEAATVLSTAGSTTALTASGWTEQAEERKEEEEEDDDEEVRVKRIEKEKVKRRSMLQGLRIKRNSFLMEHFHEEDGEEEDGDEDDNDFAWGGEDENHNAAWDHIQQRMMREDDGSGDEGERGESDTHDTNRADTNSAGWHKGRGQRRANRRSSQRQVAQVASMSVLVESLEESHLRNLRVVAEAREHSKRKLARRRESQEKQQKQQQQRTIRRRQRASVAMLQTDAAALAKSNERKRIKTDSVRLMHTLKYGWSAEDDLAADGGDGELGSARAQAGAAYENRGSKYDSKYGDVTSDAARRKRAARHWVLPEECESEMRQLLMLMVMDVHSGGSLDGGDGIVRVLTMQQVHEALELFGLAPVSNSMMSAIKQKMQEQRWEYMQQRHFDGIDGGLDGDDDSDLYRDDEEEEGLIGIEELMTILIPACGTVVDMAEMEALFSCYDDCEPETTTRVLELGDASYDAEHGQQQLTAETSVRTSISTLHHVLCGGAPSLGRPLDKPEYELLLSELAAHAPGLVDIPADASPLYMEESGEFDARAATASGTANLLEFMRDVTAGYAPVA